MLGNKNSSSSFWATIKLVFKNLDNTPCKRILFNLLLWNNSVLARKHKMLNVYTKGLMSISTEQINWVRIFWYPQGQSDRKYWQYIMKLSSLDLHRAGGGDFFLSGIKCQVSSIFMQRRFQVMDWSFWDWAFVKWKFPRRSKIRGLQSQICWPFVNITSIYAFWTGK